MKNFLNLLLPSALFLLALFVVGTNLSKPFWGTHDWNGARSGNNAKNYIRHGYLETKLGQVQNGGESDPKDFIYYTHFQPLLPILISFSYHINGVKEYATRVVPLIATAGLVVIIYFIGIHLINWQLGLFASLLTLATPMVRYYGKNPVHEPLTLFFAALTFLGALIFKKSRNPTLLLIGFILTGLTNWPYALLLLGLTFLLFNPKNRKILITLWVLGAVLTSLNLFHIFVLTGNPLGGGLMGAFLERTSAEQIVTKFNLIDYVLRIRLWASTLFTNTLLTASLVGLVLLLKSKLSEFKRFILAVAIFCLYPLSLANATFIHSYFIYYFTLPLSILGGYLCLRLVKSRTGLVLVVAILAGVWFERSSYLTALQESRGDALAVEVAGAIKSKTNETDRIQVIPSEYGISRMPILSYYSGRNIVLTVDADWVVQIRGDDYELTKNTGKQK